MALPTTITLISTTIASCGPYISSAGNVYVFGQDASDVNIIRACKATDPTTSFSSSASFGPGLGTASSLSADQVADVIHFAATFANSGTTQATRYFTFNMATDTYTDKASATTNVNSQTSAGTQQFGCSIKVRSNGNAVLHYNGTRVANMGNSYAQTYYREWTGAAFGTEVQVSAGGQVDFTTPETLLGASDRVQFLFLNATAATGVQRALTSANALQTANTALSTPFSGAFINGISYDNAGTQKIVSFWPSATPQVDYFDDGNTPTVNIATPANLGSATFGRPFNDGTDAYILFRFTTDSDLYVSKSSDNGATWGTKASAFVATVNNAEANLSIDGNIFTRGSSVVIPYVVNDNGTLKYNEYVVRTIVSDTLFAQAVM